MAKSPLACVLIKRTLCALAICLLLVPAASADVIRYDLSDKAPGAQNPPDYGLRIDGLFGNPSSIWTFSFVQSTANVFMDIDTVNATAHIHGTAWGAEDVGSVWNPGSGYEWELDFFYSDLTITDATTGYWHASMFDGTTNNINVKNRGALTLLSDENVDGVGGSDVGRSILLADFKGGDFYLDSNKGPYVSAWLGSTDGFAVGADNPTNYQTYKRTGGTKDFGFKAENPTLMDPVPEPGSLTVFALASMIGFGGTSLRRRRRS